MANILDSVRLSGVTYMLAASGGTGGSGVTSGQVETMIRNYTYDKLTIDRKIDNAFDPDQYYTKADIDIKESDLNERIDELSGKTLTVSGKVSTLEDDVENAYQEIKNVRLELSGAIDTKQDILVAGDNIIITGNVISAVMSGGSGVTSAQVQTMIDQSVSGKANSSDVYLKTETSGKTQLSTAFNNKQDKLVAGDNIIITGNVISAIMSGGSGVTSGDVQTMINQSISGKADTSYVDEQTKVINGKRYKYEMHRAGDPFDYTKKYYGVAANFDGFDDDFLFGFVKKITEIEDCGVRDNVFTLLFGVVDNEYFETDEWHLLSEKRIDCNDSAYWIFKTGLRFDNISTETTTYPFDCDMLVADEDDEYATITDVDALESGVTLLNGDVNMFKNSAFTDAEYDSVNKLIKFKNVNGTVIDQIDATDFIKDGMIEDVQISGTDLVITFNTYSGLEDIVIPLASIFDPNNYYTKTEVNTLISNKADVWCGNASQWAAISGSTQSGTLYLIY